MASNRQVVSVGTRTGTINGLDEPRFLVEADGKLYLTLAVLEYDPGHPGITEHQASAIERLGAVLAGGQALRAVRFGEGAVAGEGSGAGESDMVAGGQFANINRESAGEQFANINPESLSGEHFANINPQETGAGFANIEPGAAQFGSTDPPG